MALVFPYFRTRARTEVLFPPLGPALLSAHLKKAGVEARVFDGTFSSFDQLLDQLVAWRPAIVGISAMVSLTGNALRIAAAVRERLPEALLVAGGPLPTVFPDRFLPHVDVVFCGEADSSFPAFCREYLKCGATPPMLGDLPLEEYAGLVADARGRRVANAPVHHSQEEIAGYPLPDRGDFDHRAYQREWAPTGYRPTTLLATLGCPYDCEFCSKPVFGTAVRVARSTRSSRRSTTSSASGTTACGSPTTRSRSTVATWRSSAGVSRRSASGGVACRAPTGSTPPPPA